MRTKTKSKPQPRVKSKPKPMWKRVVGAIAYVAFLSLFVAGGAVAERVSRSTVIKAAISQAIREKPPQQVFYRDELTVLLLGCDVDLAPGGKKVLKKQARTDMMLVAKLDFKNKRISGVSIPRDTECQLPGYRSMKINAYHAIAQPGQEADLTKQAVEHILPGVGIDKVITLDYDAFQKVVDMLGGVPMIIDKPMEYTDRAGGLFIDFQPGKQVLNGYDAMCYVRYRKGKHGAITDFERQENQKKFLVAFKNRVMSKPMLIPEVAEEAKSVLGNALDADQIVSLAFFGKDVKPQDIQMGQIPVRDGRGTRLVVDERRLPEVLSQYGLGSTFTAQVSYAR